MGRKWSEIPIAELSEMAQSLHYAVYVRGCYSSKDVINYDSAVDELERRGCRVAELRTLDIEEPEEEDE